MLKCMLEAEEKLVPCVFVMTNKTDSTHQCWIHCQYLVLILAVLQDHTRFHPLTPNYLS